MHPQGAERFPLKRGCLRSDQVPCKTGFPAVAVTAAALLQVDQRLRLFASTYRLSHTQYEKQNNQHAYYPYRNSAFKPKSDMLHSTGSETLSL